MVRLITREQKIKAEQQSIEWNSPSFIYTIPDSDNPELLRIDPWDHYKWKKEDATLIASVSVSGWEIHDSHFELENTTNIETVEFAERTGKAIFDNADTTWLLSDKVKSN